MAEKNTVDKVKELLDGHVYAPLRDAAEKWLEEADEKYDVKEKAEKAWDKLTETAENFSESSIKFNEKMAGASEKLSASADKFAEKAVPVLEEIKDMAAPKVGALVGKAAPKVEDLKEKAAPAVDKITESELIKQLKAGVATLDEVIDTFSKPEMRANVGEEAAEQIKKHAEEMKAAGKKFCDCPACTKAREILKDLGVDLETETESAETEESGE